MGEPKFELFSFPLIKRFRLLKKNNMTDVSKTKTEMTFSLSATSSSVDEGLITSRENEFAFGATKTSELPSPAELLIGAFAACCLKNVERFSTFMKFDYDHAEIKVVSTRQTQPPMIRSINFDLVVYSNGAKINEGLLLRNLQKFGTIYNTLNAVCEIDGNISVK